MRPPSRGATTWWESLRVRQQLIEARRARGRRPLPLERTGCDTGALGLIGTCRYEARDQRTPAATGVTQLMAYALYKLAPGSYDLELDGVLVGGVVRNGERASTWRAELLDDEPAGGMPKPFTQPEHKLPSLEAILHWLGGAQVEGER